MTLTQLSDRDKFIVARWAYSVGEPIISDAEYTQLLNYMQATYPEDEYVLRSWSSDPCPTELLKQLGMENLIYSVVIADKTESIPSLNSTAEFLKELGNITEPGTLSMKHDGWNVQANYYQGALVNVMTRGRSSDAMDVTKIQSLFPQTIPYKNKCKVVCELTISKSNFNICRVEFNNVSSRSAVSTVLARPDRYDLLDFHAFDIHGMEYDREDKFDILQSWGFKTPKFIKTQNTIDIKQALNELSEAEHNYNSPTDGAVYDGSFRRAIRLGAWEEPIYRSYVTGYYEQFGPYRISPSIEIYPINRKGTTQRRINITNWRRIILYDLQPGAPVAFRVASSAIADFDEESTRLLHQTYEGRWEEFKAEVEQNENYNKMAELLSGVQ